MYTKQELDKFYNELSLRITISDEMFEKARKEYEDLGKWIDKQTPNYKAQIYAQGSFALGTVIKPISEEDDYDIDLVCELDKDYGLTARDYKLNVSKNWLTSYRKHSKELEEKRRCWHVEYDDVKNFHMDVIPAFYLFGETINITEHDEKTNKYTYIKSNPKGYISWFFSRCNSVSTRLFDSYTRDQRIRITEAAEIENIKRNKLKNPLQKAIMILKRHRDVMFSNDSDNKPISIIITTLAALSYNDSDSICDVLENFFVFTPNYLSDHLVNGVYCVPNPTDETDNFANKWVDYPERRDAFFDWFNRAKTDLCFSQVKNKDRVTLGKHFKAIIGETVATSIYEKFAKESKESIVLNETKVNTKKGTLSKEGNMVIPLNHHHHED